jgi:1-acyl-sn-glycerol-3-phosphate acyltransferase
MAEEETTTEQTHAEPERDAAALLDLVRALVIELHPRRGRRIRVTLDSYLDRELGFDSLSRVELLLRVQRKFGVGLPEHMVADAETPRDLLQALDTAGTSPVGFVGETFAAVDLGEVDSTPDTAETLLDVLDWHVERNPMRPHVYLYGDANQPETVTHQTLIDGARAVAAGLQVRGLQKGQAVSIMLPTSVEYLYSFFGVLLAGGVPVPIYPPLRPAQIEDHLRRHAGILANAETVTLITDANARRVGRLLQAHVPALHEIVTPHELATANGAFTQPVITAEDVAFLQYTSGSTGQPKGVILTHANLLANIRAMGAAVAADSTDLFVSWLPLYHDMGLIGAWLASLYFGMPLVLMSPLKFLTYPPRWLRAIHEHRATLTAAPNFAYEFCLSKIEPRELAGLDLSSLRMAFNGAEPVSPNTVRRFTQRFARYGFRPEAFAPVYGLAESAVGLAFPPLKRGPIIDRIQRRSFEASGRALPAQAGDAQALEFVACGQPLPGYEIRIADTAGHELPDRQEGRLEFQGPSATSGYVRNPEATARLFDGPWLDSGDLAYIAGGDVYLTRRVKDIIIRGGRNVYPYALEEAIGDLTGIRKGCVAVFGSPDPTSGTERVVVVAETRETEATTLDRLRRDVEDVATDVLDMPPDEVVLTPPHTVLKTSSGKIRRAAVRELFEAGRLGQRPRAVWWQILRLALTAWQSRLRNLSQRTASAAYAGYACLAMAIIALPVWLLVALLPRASWRYAVARRSAQLLLRITGVPVTVAGLDQVPLEEAAVVVANHASYLDGLVLMAALPRQVAFVAKSELDRQFIAGRFLRGIGATFVERFDVERSVADAEHIAKLAATGRSILFFPEGTFTRAPGLMPFHMGAFVTAAEVSIPIVPVTLVGTRSLLRADSWRPCRGAVRVAIGHPLTADGHDWSAAVQLRDAVRRAILTELDEPDLARVD